MENQAALLLAPGSQAPEGFAKANASRYFFLATSNDDTDAANLYPLPNAS